jgi:antirestriction protein ArdC
MTSTIKPTTVSTTVKDVYQIVTNIIIEQLEKGVIPWQQSWSTSGLNVPLGLPSNQITGNYYRGINIVLLWAAATKNNFKTSEWASFKQWQSKNEFVRKGEKGNLVVYYDTFEKENDGEIQKIPFLKASYVFNRCQLSSYQEPEVKEPAYTPGIIEQIDEVDIFLENTKAIIETHDGSACYKIQEDKILVPYPESFHVTPTCTATEGFYSTILHELIHWSGAKHRLDRTKGKKFGDQNYAVEELVAEFGAAFLCAGFGIATVEKGDHAGYIDHWLKVLKENNRYLVTAASEASKAADYLRSLQPK